MSKQATITAKQPETRFNRYGKPQQGSIVISANYDCIGLIEDTDNQSYWGAGEFYAKTCKTMVPDWYPNRLGDSDECMWIMPNFVMESVS